ncbi:MAG: hypothetical protein ACJ71U_04390 [Terriglobales bacterium]
MKAIDSNWFKAQWVQAKSRAGKRYTPELDISLPIYEFFESLGQDKAFFDRLQELSANFEKAKKEISRDTLATKAANENSLPKLLDESLAIIRSFSEMRSKAPVELVINPVCKAFQETSHALELLTSELRAAESPKESVDRSRFEYRIEKVREAQQALMNIEDFLTGPQGRVANARKLLMLGAAGSGKTHLFCEMTARRIAQDLPSLLFLGQTFRAPFSDPLEVLLKSIAPDANPDDLISEIDQFARKRGVRCIIAIDAINEGDRESWTKALPVLVEKLAAFQGIALAISCRTPFQHVLAPDSEKLGFQSTFHVGYPADEQDVATEKYFKAHSIPLPEVPLLEEEFSNPLFLKLFCEALEKVTVTKQHAQLTSIASGQRGMTHILEYFVRQKDQSISKRFGTPPGLSWRYLKNVLAPELAARHSDSIPLKDAEALANGSQPPGMPAGTLLHALIEEDVLAEDVAFAKDVPPQEVVRFTYQKFSDHLIARHLLSAQLDPSDPGTIKASLADPNRLGFFFADEDAALNYANVAQAIMIEFPTRIHNQGELLDFVGWKGIPIRLCEGFVEGLYWREARSINSSTERWISAFLGYDALRHKTLNVLLALSVKPQHPFSFKRLEKFLGPMAVVERDLFWTEYLRKSRHSGTAQRILSWVEHSASKPLARDFAEAYTTVLKWCLASTQRAFRDRVTHALVRVGCAKPTVLFEQTLNSLSLNDPYIRERMLAASYGVGMARWEGEPDNRFNISFINFARAIFNSMFAPDAPHGTTHILARDYARKIIELALTGEPALLDEEQQKLITPPFKFGGIREWKEADDRDKGKYRNGDNPLGMDFANYTLGRLARDRRNYDFEAPNYQEVRNQVLWRIYDLGYSLEAFSQIDQEIAREGWHYQQRGRESSKTDRYGKKYAWIAYFELAGYRQDLGLFERDGERIPDVDIDPSFPERPKSSQVFQSQWLAGEGSVRDWLYSNFVPPVAGQLIVPELEGDPGPWILLHGFVERSSEDKSIFSFLDGILVQKQHTKRLIELLTAMEYPGNDAIPRPESEYYTFAGEVPWADTWRHQQYPQTIGSGSDEIPVVIPIRDYAWESYHSNENQSGGIPFLAKEVAADLQLYVRIPSIRMAERGSLRSATKTVCSGESYKDSESILFIRKDLLDRYMAKHGMDLILFVWGERRANYHSPGSPEEARALEGDFRVEDVLHRQGFIYSIEGFQKFL